MHDDTTRSAQETRQKCGNIRPMQTRRASVEDNVPSPPPQPSVPQPHDPPSQSSVSQSHALGQVIKSKKENDNKKKEAKSCTFKVYGNIQLTAAQQQSGSFIMGPSVIARGWFSGRGFLGKETMYMSGNR
ncbi:uncharacterized protein LOC109837150 [Asparagus officinalis]|uniref:uncharacterized protein LOC109837150 n=1 Tax=Asparagus officinalis TaxID=4686 RepID=UPI00098E685A|nr:uncharacterized protein LOC109837150 [Asparagus officinalis]